MPGSAGWALSIEIHRSPNVTRVTPSDRKLASMKPKPGVRRSRLQNVPLLVHSGHPNSDRRVAAKAYNLPAELAVRTTVVAFKQPLIARGVEEPKWVARCRSRPCETRVSMPIA